MVKQCTKEFLSSFHILKVVFSFMLSVYSGNKASNSVWKIIHKHYGLSNILEL